jgi:hypothetical protein
MGGSLGWNLIVGLTTPRRKVNILWISKNLWLWRIISINDLNGGKLVWGVVHGLQEIYGQWRMPSSVMLRPVTLVRTDVSEENIFSFIRVTRIGELRITLAIISNWSRLRTNTTITRVTWRNNPDDCFLRSYRHEHLKSYIWVNFPHDSYKRSIAI